MQYADTILDLVGNTPLVRISRLTRDLGPAGRPAAAAGQARDAQPGRLGQGPDRAADDRGRRACGSAQARAARSSSPRRATPATALRSPPRSRAIAASSSWPTSSRPRSRRCCAPTAPRSCCAPTNVAPESPESYYSVAARLARDIPGAFKPGPVLEPREPGRPRAHDRARDLGPDRGPDHATSWRRPAPAAPSAGPARYLKSRNPAIRVIGADPEGSVLQR